MKRLTLTSSIALVLILLVNAADPAEAAEFEFHARQLVYIHAQTVDGVDDSAFESRLRGRFLDYKVFYVTNKIAEADFVFWAFTDYRTQTIDLECEKIWEPCTKTRRYLAFAEGFALSPDDYQKGFASRDDLRGKAHWQWLVGAINHVSIPERRSRKLVKTFHEQAVYRVASK